MSIQFNQITITPSQLYVGESFFISVSVGKSRWVNVKNNFSNWEGVKNHFTNWRNLISENTNEFAWNDLKNDFLDWNAVRGGFSNWQLVKNFMKGVDYVAIKQVRVKINNAWTTLTYNETTGNYEATIAAPNITSYNVNSGHYYPVTVEATNMAGTVSTVDDTDDEVGSSLRLKVKEATKPVIAITAPTASAYLSTNTPEITFTITDETNGSGVDISTLKIKVDSTTYTNTSSGVTITSITNGKSVKFVPQTALSDGSHTVTINCSDYDGNAATAKSVSFTVDTVAPTLTITAPSENGLYVANAAYTVVGTTNDATSSVASVSVKLNGVDQGTVTVGSNGSFSKSISLASGLNTIIVTATDRAGKTTTVTRTINLDTSAPDITSVIITPNPVGTGSSFVISVKVE